MLCVSKGMPIFRVMTMSKLDKIDPVNGMFIIGRNLQIRRLTYRSEVIYTNYKMNSAVKTIF